MNVQAFKELLDECLVFSGSISSASALRGLKVVQINNLFYGVNMLEALKRKDSIVSFLWLYPDYQKLAEGPSYLAVANWLNGDEETALKLFAIGEVIGLWQVVSPRIETNDEKHVADMLFRGGFTYITGYTLDGIQV